MAEMRAYLLSLGAGLLVGMVYSLLNVRSPASPVVAVVGLLGILIGEQIIPVARHRKVRRTSWASCPGVSRRQCSMRLTPRRSSAHDPTHADRRSDPASWPVHDA